MSENDDRESLQMEPRRPQVGDEVEVRQWGSREDWRKVTVQSVKVTPALTRVSVDGGDSYLHEAPDDAPTRSPGKTYGWRWPATQGAAVAGPAPGCPTCGQLCPLIVGGHYICTRPLPHAHTPEEVLASLRTLTPPPPAVAGPARECPLPCVLPPGHEGLHRLSPPPPASSTEERDRYKGCPFCDSVDIITEREGTPRESCIVACNDCGARLESNEIGDGEAWDRRPREAALAVELSETEKTLLVEMASHSKTVKERDQFTAAKAALEVQLAEALILVAPFGGGDLLVGIRHLQRSLEREIDEHQRHHEEDEEREHLIQSLRQEVDDGKDAFDRERVAHDALRQDRDELIEHHKRHHEYEDKLEARLAEARKDVEATKARLAAAIQDTPAMEPSAPHATCTCGHPRSQHWGNDAHPGCHEPQPPFGDDGSCDTCRCMGFVAAPAPLYYLLSEKWTQGDYITWWRADSRGYTRRLADAGKYTREEARRIAHYSVIPVRCQEAEALAVRVVALDDDSRKWLRVAVRWKRMLESRWKREHADWPVCGACNGRRGRWDDEAVDQWYPCERCNETGKESPTRPQIVTAPSSSAPIPPGGDRPEECPCCFSEDTPEGADCFCPDWCPEQCEGGEVHRG